VTFLYRLAGEPDVSDLPALSIADYAEIARLDWAEDAIRWAAAIGVTIGFDSDNTFRPNISISREQIATMLYRYAEIIGESTEFSPVAFESFPDREAVSWWSDTAMRWVTYTGIIMGLRGNLAPGNNATRAEIVTMLYRFVDTFDIPAP
jgi:hypothetical protein